MSEAFAAYREKLCLNIHAYQRWQSGWHSSIRKNISDCMNSESLRCLDYGTNPSENHGDSGISDIKVSVNILQFQCLLSVPSKWI